MTIKEARVLIHKMYKHIHDDRVTCAKCEAIGYFKALEGQEVKSLVAALENSVEGKCIENLCQRCEALEQYERTIKK